MNIIQKQSKAESIL